MRLLAVDPSAVCGFAHGDPHNEGPPFSGVFTLPKDSTITRRMIALESWAIDMIKGNGITDVYVEKPILPQKTSFSSVAAICGYAFTLGVAATKCGCYCEVVEMQSWRSELGLPTQGPKNVLADPHYAGLFGKRKSALRDAKRQWVKDRAMDFARRMGSDPADDNEGDAICIWHAMARRRRAKEEAPKYDLFRDLSI